MERPGDEENSDKIQDEAQGADANAALVEAVFAELNAKRPDGVRYMTLRLEGDMFVHLVESDAVDGPSPLQQLDAFLAFQCGIRERCVEGLDPSSATLVGNTPSSRLIGLRSGGDVWWGKP